ncbi:hypothetical protein DXG01_017052 [Tephrocybe rancida]|nr:hypothetical protein DXG01_017052 [Tephrocybe rancida]
MDPKTVPWFQSPPPTRAATPIYQQNPYLANSEDHLHLAYRSRIRPNRVQVIDPEERVNHFDAVSFSDSAITTDSRDWAEVRYRRDEQGQEMSETACVWKIYNDEAAKFDSSLTEGWNRGVDVLLVFTGLFSAVLTTFIIQSFQLMVPDASETTNALLQKLIAFQTNSDQIVIPPPKQTPTPLQVTWVNGLWFAALACSLSTALISMLAKQWLQAYNTNMSGSPLQRARQRQSRYNELVSWHVLALINALPLLLHAALLLFFAGIVILLWSVNRATTLATLLIVAFAYIFYFGSIFLPIIYPGCPYQHPNQPTSDDFHQLQENEEGYIKKRTDVVTRDNKLDASALIWLLDTSTDKCVISAALQAIAGLPREFSASQILHDAGVVHLIEQGFQSCFDKDTTIDLKWHLIDTEGAWLYCKAWMNMTRGTSKQWPLELLDPLWKLQDCKDHADGAAIASCAIALSSVDSHLPQWELLSYISRYVSGDVQLSHCTVTWILDSMIDCLTEWEMPIAVIEKTTIRAVPVLLRLLKHIEDLPTSSVRSAAGLALCVFTCGSVDALNYRSEDRRRDSHATVMVKALTTIVAAPERFGVGELIDVVAKELSRLASPMVSQSHRFSAELKGAARASLATLLMSERIAVDIIPDPTLADVLHLLSQSRVPNIHRPAFVKLLVKTLLTSSHQDVASWSVRLLRPLLTECSLGVAQTFTEDSGIHAVLRAARIGDIDNRRLQVDSWRSLCAFIDSSISLHPSSNIHEPRSPVSIEKDYAVDEVFRSDLLETVCAVIASRRWWLFEVSGRWESTFVNLCKLRPHERVWKKLINVIRDTNKRGKDHEGMSDIVYQLESILNEALDSQPSDADEMLDDNLSIHSVPMSEQRLALRPTTTQLLLAQERLSTSTWFETE